MSKPRPPDRFEKAVDRMITHAKCVDNPCICETVPRASIVTLLRREHAAIIRLANKCAVGNVINKADFLAALDKRRR